GHPSYYPKSSLHFLFFEPQNVEQEMSNLEIILRNSAVPCSAVRYSKWMTKEPTSKTANYKMKDAN
ncbi:MAG: hypothetical protein U9Q89_05510, partial [Thermodesulfobacteriota bacterium]|nr:hypothetical protein [Thermodesulfobacteriota bacterium]